MCVQPDPPYRQPMSLDTEGTSRICQCRPICISRLIFRTRRFPRIDHLCRVMLAGFTDRGGEVSSRGLTVAWAYAPHPLLTSVIDVACLSAFTIAAGGALYRTRVASPLCCNVDVLTPGIRFLAARHLSRLRRSRALPDAVRRVCYCQRRRGDRSCCSVRLAGVRVDSFGSGSPLDWPLSGPRSCGQRSHDHLLRTRPSVARRLVTACRLLLPTHRRPALNQRRRRLVRATFGTRSRGRCCRSLIRYPCRYRRSVSDRSWSSLG